jgi:hypothetical protein
MSKSEILAELADVNENAGNYEEAPANRREARQIVMQIAESLREVEFYDSFLNQAQIRKLFS